MRVDLERQPDGAYAPLRPRAMGNPPPDDGVDRYSTGPDGLHWPAKRGNKHQRKPGSNNLLRIALKTLILEGAAASKRGRGSVVRYLAALADEHPTVYARLIGKLVPSDVRLSMRAELDTRIETVSDIRQQLAERGIPLPPSLFEVPQTPEQLAQQRHQRRDEDTLAREPEGFSTTENPPRTDNIYSANYRPPPATYGPPALGEQLTMPWPSTVPPENHAWAEARPLHLAINNEEPTHDLEVEQPPPQAAAAK
jgi:hypothetical protein